MCPNRIPAPASGLAGWLGESAAARAVREFGARAAAVDAPVLITGESGTGKGLLARSIHLASPRSRGPFVAVNCAGVPDSLFESEFFGYARGAFTGAHSAHRGLFEQAHQGTLFLDEIGELSTPLQAKLLTTLEEGEVRRLGSERFVSVNTRLIAATGLDLEDAVSAGRFRRDLYHRLVVLTLRLPALRERADDLPALVEHFLRVSCSRYGRSVWGISGEALVLLRNYSWPGNIRELAHALEAAVLTCESGAIAPGDLPRAILRGPAAAGGDGSGPGWGTAAADLSAAAEHGRPRDSWSAPRAFRYSFAGSPEQERSVIEEALRRARGNKTRAASELGMARNTLRTKLRRLGIGKD